MGILSIITGLSDFKTKLDEYQNESMSRLGTAGYDSTVAIKGTGTISLFLFLF
jgi:hypothetical protein